MSVETRLYVGSERGLSIWRSKNGAWDQESEETLDTGAFWRIEGSHARPEQVFVAVSGSGLFRTDDAGKNWSKVLDRDVRSVTADPSDSRVIYAGTEPIHLYRSEDSGDHWEDLSSLQDMPEEVRKEWWFPVPPNIAHVLNIFVHPDDPRIIYLCLEHGGVVRSLDRGATWEDVSQGIDYVDMHMISSLPHRLDRYYVSSARGFFTSDDPSKGWVRAENGFTRDYFHDFLFLPPTTAGGNPTMLAATADKSPGSWSRPEHAQAAVFRSFDCGESWHQVGEGLPDRLEPAIWGLTGHPADPNTAFVGLGKLSMRTPTENGPGTVLTTRDRGDSWDALPVQVPSVRALWAAAE